MPTANFQNYDYDTEAEAIKRQQALADIMRQQSAMPVEVPTAMAPHQVQAKISPIALIAKMLQGGLAGHESRSVDERRRELTRRYEDDLKTGMQQYEDTARGNPGITLPPGLEGPVVAPTPGDPRKAIMEAIASNHPQLKQFAMQQLAEQTKGQLTPKDLLPHANPEAIPGMIQGGLAGFKPKVELGFAPPGEVAYNKNTGQTAQLGAAPDGAPGWKTVEIGGDTYQLTSSGLKKLDNSTKITNNVDVAGNRAANKFAEKVSEHRADQLSKSFEASKGLPQTLTNLEEASKSLDQGVRSGVLSDVAVTLSKLGTQLGLQEASPQDAASEVYRASMANSVLEVLKTLRPASDKDVEYAKAAAGADLSLALPALQKLVDSAKVATANKLYEHNQLLEGNKRGSGAITEDLDTFNVPFSVSGDNMEFRNGRFVSTQGTKSGGKPNGKVLTLDEYLKGVR